jgi:hypothetical protein
MNRTIAVAALALLMTSGAQANSTDAIINTIWARFAGSHNRCPRFQVIERAISAERAEAGATAWMMESFDEEPRVLIKEYNEDPSAFCNKAWQEFGPNGSYKRQMLEAK